MTTADALEPYPEQTISGAAELIVRSWRRSTMLGVAVQKLSPESGRRGRANARETVKRRRISAA